MAHWFSYSRSNERWEMAADLEAVATQAMTILTLEEQARFLELHPAWSPMLNDESEVVGMQGPSGTAFPLESIANFACEARQPGSHPLAQPRGETGGAAGLG